jgi:hypothetical protein
VNLLGFWPPLWCPSCSCAPTAGCPAVQGRIAQRSLSPDSKNQGREPPRWQRVRVSGRTSPFGGFFS